MKRILPLLLSILLLAGCNTPGAEPAPIVLTTTPVGDASGPSVSEPAETLYVSRFSEQTQITLSDEGITVNGGSETDTVYTSHDIIYYEDRDYYPSGNPYGDGDTLERHSAAEAESHTVVNITAPGAYRISGKLSAGQIRIDLGKDAYDDPDAVVELILDNADVTCNVAPAILFLNVYECDGSWSEDTAKPDVDTSAAGANLILAEGSQNLISGSHVAKIYKDKNGEKKLWKQDGAVYAYMSMNVFGPGKLDIFADNEGLDTELHLTINGGEIAIRSANDGINTNEDGVSVTTINAGRIHIIAGLGAEGDGIDSNGYLVIRGGTVVSAAHPASDAGLDSDLGSYIHGGTVIALGSAMDWAESDSGQVTMNLQFAHYQDSGSAIVVTREDGAVLFAYDPGEDTVLGQNSRSYQGAILSSPNFRQGESYHVYLDGQLTGSVSHGIYDAATVTAYEGGTQMLYTGTDVRRGPGGFGGGSHGDRGQHPEKPEGDMPPDFQGKEPPEGWGKSPDGNGPSPSEGNTRFYMQDRVNFFSGLTAAN